MYSQIGPRESYLLTVVDTAWLYPTSNIEAALAATTVPYTRSGNQIVAATIADLNQIANAIYANTTIDLSGGFSLRTGLLLKDLGKVLTFKTTSGELVAEWRLARLITDQIGTPGGAAAPPGTVGYLPIFYSEGNATGRPFDPVRVVRVS